MLVLLRVEKDGVVLLDPPMPPYFLPMKDFLPAWTGNILVFPHDKEEEAALRGTDLWRAYALYGGVAFGLAGGVALLFLAFHFIRRQALIHRSLDFAFSHLWRSSIGRIAIGGAVIGVCVWLFAVPALPRIPEPKCVLPEADMELGELPPQQLTVRVPIRNDGAESLKIAAVKSSCSCAVVHYPKEIPPGKTNELVVDLRIASGPQRARLIVESNDPAGEQSVLISWHGQAKPFLDPWLLDVSGIPPDQAFKTTVNLVYPGGRRAIIPTIESVHCDSPYVALTIGENRSVTLPHILAGPDSRTFGSRAIHVRVTSPETSTTINTSCLLNVRYGTKQHQLRFPISVRFSPGGDLSADVAQFVLSAPEPGQLVGQRRTIHLTCDSGCESIELEGLPDWLKGETARSTRTKSEVKLRIVSLPQHGMARALCTMM